MSAIAIPFHGRLLERAVHPLDLPVRSWMVRRCSMPFAAPVMSNRMGREQGVLQLRGCSQNWMPLLVSIVWILQGTASSTASGNSQAVLRFALSNSCTTANLLVRSRAKNRYHIPSLVRTSAMSIWKYPREERLNFCRLGLSPSISGSRDVPCRRPGSGVAKIASDAGGLVVTQTTITHLQERMTPKSDNHRVFIGAQNRGTGVRWTNFAIFNRFALAPFCTRFDIDTEVPPQRHGYSVRALYCSSDSVLSRGAAVTYLPHTGSFHSKEQIAPSNHRIKRLSRSCD